MKIQVTLTTLASLVLAACSGGGNGDSTNNEAPKVELNSPQQQAPNVEKKEDKKEGKAEQVKPSDKNSENKAENESSLQSAPPKTNEASTVESPKMPEVDKNMAGVAQSSDQSVFNKLSISSNDNTSLTGDTIYKLELEGKEIKLNLLSEEKFKTVIEPQIETLRDSNGVLVGYTGYAKVNEITFDDYSQPNGQKLKNIYVQDMDSAQAQQPTASNLTYKGKMNYYYGEKEGGAQGQNQIADVKAIYDGSHKTLSMDIEDREADGKYWKLYDNNHARSNSVVSVESNGSVSGYLLELNEYKKPIVNSNYNGLFTGGFYGKNGEFLVGKAESKIEGKWQGIIKAEPEKKNQ